MILEEVIIIIFVYCIIQFFFFNENIIKTFIIIETLSVLILSNISLLSITLSNNDICVYTIYILVIFAMESALFFSFILTLIFYSLTLRYNELDTWFG